MSSKIVPDNESTNIYIHRHVSTTLGNIRDELEEHVDEAQARVRKFYGGWKSFAFKDDITNVAIGMIIATSFKNVVRSLIVDIFMPLLIGFGAGVNTENLFIILRDGKTNTSYVTLEDAKNDGAVTLNYGLFLHVFIDLIFVSVVLYLFMKFLNRIKKEISQEIKRIENKD